VNRSFPKKGTPCQPLYLYFSLGLRFDGVTHSKGTRSRHIVLGGLHSLLCLTIGFESFFNERRVIPATRSSKVKTRTTLINAKRRNSLVLDSVLKVENTRSFVGYCAEISTVPARYDSNR